MAKNYFEFLQSKKAFYVKMIINSKLGENVLR